MCCQTPDGADDLHVQFQQPARSRLELVAVMRSSWRYFSSLIRFSTSPRAQQTFP